MLFFFLIFPLLGENYETFSRDVKPPTVVFKEAKDNGSTKLHPARWHRGALVPPEDYYDQTPVNHVHIYKNIPLKHLGMQHKVCDKTIIAMHDKRVTLNIKHFLTENVGVAAKPRVTYSGPDGSTHSDFAWVEANTVNQCQEAMLNYDCINHHLYSWDYTGLVMQRLMIKHRWLAAYQSVPTTRVNLVKLFFNSVLRTNASKAVNREAPLDYKEQSELLDGILAAGGQPITAATSPNYQIPKNQGKSSGGNQWAGSSNTAAGGNNNKKKDNRKAGRDEKFCWAHNSMAGENCSNTRTSTGCSDGKGGNFTHKCNIKLPDGRYCNRSHRRKDH